MLVDGEAFARMIVDLFFPFGKTMAGSGASMKICCIHCWIVHTPSDHGIMYKSRASWIAYAHNILCFALALLVANISVAPLKHPIPKLLVSMHLAHELRNHGLKPIRGRYFGMPQVVRCFGVLGN